MRYDALILGAGFSGLAAGIRLAHFGKSVCLLERHAVPGGLNSYYRRGGRDFDVGLHAMTNYVPAGTRGAPLTKLLRQLRLRHEELDLVEQTASRIHFPDEELRVTNDFSVLRAEVARAFPDELAGFDRLAADLAAYDSTALDLPAVSAREKLAGYLRSPDLLEMLLCPLQYYGSAWEGDMEFSQFAIMFDSLYRSGFCRPRRGTKPLLAMLLQKFRENGGEARFGCGAEALETEGDTVARVRLETGEALEAERVFSSAGWVETMALCDDRPAEELAAEAGRLSFVELILCLDAEPAALGLEHCIEFVCRERPFRYRAPETLVDASSFVLCVPDNFAYEEPSGEGRVRLTMQASYDAWRALVGPGDHRRAAPEARARYAEAKAETEATLRAVLAITAPRVNDRVVFSDLFTPLTVEHYTGHARGAVYGSPRKHRRGETPYGNLFLIGTDQGFLGIVGAMLSGISMANLHGLP